MDTILDNSNDSRNVADEFKGWTNEMIRQTLKERCFPFSALMTQLSGDFNIGTLIRNANAFNASEVFYFGTRKHIDRRGAVGTYHYTDVNYIPSVEGILQLKQTYMFVGLENEPGAQPLHEFAWDFTRPTLMVFGEESSGIPQELKDLCDALVYIPQFGSVRSLNVGTASGVAMYDYVSKYNQKKA